MVVHFHRNAQLLQHQAHLRTHVLEAVNGWHRKVAALDGGAVTGIAMVKFFARVPSRLFRVDFVEAAGHVVGPTHTVKHEKLGLRTKVSGVTKAGGFHVRLSALGQRAGITLVGFAVSGVDHIAAQNHRRFFKEGVNVGGVGVGHELHVRGFNAFPTGDGRSVKRVSIGELVFIEVRHRHGHVLLFTAGVGEAEVNKFNLIFFHHLHDVCDSLGHSILLVDSLFKRFVGVNAGSVPCW